MTTIPNSKVARDPVAWLEEHGDCLYRYAIFRLREASAAEAAVHETLLTASQTKFSSGTNSERTWLVGILAQKINKPYRSASEAFTDSVNYDDYDPFQRKGEWAGFWREETAPTDWHLDTSISPVKKEIAERLNRCLSDLPPEMALAFTMIEINGLSSTEVCDALDLSRSHLSKLLHVARMRLRHSLEVEFVGSKQTKSERNLSAQDLGNRIMGIAELERTPESAKTRTASL